jgi:hypothetical protein
LIRARKKRESYPSRETIGRQRWTELPAGRRSLPRKSPSLLAIGDRR